MKLRYCRRWGPHRISYHLGVPRSTVGRVLTRYRMPLLAHLDQATGLPVRKPKPCATRRPRRGTWCMSTSRSWAGSPMAAGGGSTDADPSKTGGLGAARDRAARAGASPSRGYVYLHHAVDDSLPWPTPSSSPTNARRPPQHSGHEPGPSSPSAGIAITAVMTDNGACYRSRDFAAALEGIKHRRTQALPTSNQRQASNDSTAPWPASGPTPRPTLPTTPAPPRTPTGSTPTITTDPTPPSAASPHQPAFTT